MNPIQLTLTSGETSDCGNRSFDRLAYQHLHIEITGDGIAEPQNLIGLKLPPEMRSNQGVILEGKAPIWLYGYLVHECHATAWVGCYDPRLNGAVVVESHTKGVSVGQVLTVNSEQ